MRYWLLSVLVGLYLISSHVKGVEVLFRGKTIPTGPFLITDISFFNGTINSGDEDAIRCKSSDNVNTSSTIGDWYHDTEVESIAIGSNYRGWSTNQGEDYDFHLVVRLKRVSETAVEGQFTCHIPNDSNNNKSLLILYPILSVQAVVEVVVSKQVFRLHCISTGGRVLNTSITGPHGVVSALSNIQAVGTQRWMGNDSYSVSGSIAGADDGDAYNCTASNGVSSFNASIEIRVARKPVIQSLKWVSPTEVRVEWSQPPGGVNVTGYVVLYYDGSVTRNQTVPVNDTSTVVPYAVSYNMSVMALSADSYLPGRSIWKVIPLWSPEGVLVGVSETGSVRVSWEEVENADYYTVSFSQAVGDDQEGLCRDDSHSASVTVRVPTASIAVVENVASNETHILRAYTTYSVTVVAFSDVWGRTVGSEAVSITTPQREPGVAPSNVKATANSSTVITVKWSGLTPCGLVNGRIVGYRVQFTKPTDDATPSIEQEGTWNNASSCTLTGLTPSTNYTIAVAAVNEERTVGLYSDPVVITTLAVEDNEEQPREPHDSVGLTIVIAPLTFFAALLALCTAIAACLIFKRCRSSSPTTKTPMSKENSSASDVSMDLPCKTLGVTEESSPV